MSMTKKDFTRTLGDDYPVVINSVSINGTIIPLVVLSMDTLIFTFENQHKRVSLTGIPQEDNSVVFNIDKKDVNMLGDFTYTMKRISNGKTSTHASGVMTIEK